MQKASRPTSVPAPSDDEPNGWRTGPGRRSPLAAVPGDPSEIQRLATSQDVAGMAEQLRGVDPRAADRLDDLSAALASSDASASWADVDLRRAFNTERLAYARAVEAIGGPASRAIGVADRVRNVLVLVPILLTWFALAEASRAYASYITANPDEVRKPFLLLWESGFGGHVGPFAPSFSKVALLDAILIAIIIALTLYAHGRREDRDDEVAASATAFQTDLDNVLADASVRLALDRGARPALLANSVERLAERAREESWTHEEFLTACLQREVAARESHGGESRIRAARFPARKSLEEFDFDHARGLKRDQIAHLGTLDFITAKENVIFLGPPGTGKTHLATGLAIRACQAGHRVLFATAAQWVDRLAAAHHAGRLQDELVRLGRYPCLLVDLCRYRDYAEPAR